MRTVRADAELPLDPARAVGLWADLDRWPGFVEGFARIVEVEPAWPAAGAAVVWESGPEGRGRVSERVAEHDPGHRLVTEVTEQPAGGGPVRLRGRQTFEVASVAAPADPPARAADPPARAAGTSAAVEDGIAADLDAPRSRAELRLEYELARGRGAPGRITDLLFVRGAMRAALGRTLQRFAAEAAHETAR